MRLFKSRRGLAALVVLAAAATLFAVTALASTAGDYVDPASATAQVLPLDIAIGGTGDCANLFSGLAVGSYSEYDNVNPKTALGLASGNNDGATFDLAIAGKSKNQTLNVTAHGAEILGIGIKGGTQSTAYDYVNGPYVNGAPNNGSVTMDTGLHAPAQAWSSTTTYNGHTEEQNVTQYYSISQLTVCYTQGSISGTVYQDNNLNGGYDGTPTDGNLSGWTIHLYNSLGNLVGSATSNASGAYKIGTLFDGNAYTLCEAPPSGTWAQTEPGAGSATCTGAGELKRGWSFQPGTALANVTKNFGNVAAITCSSGPFGIPGYQVGTCKPTQTYVFSSGFTTGGQPYVSYWVGDPTQGAVSTVERVSFDDPWNGGPTLTSIKYEDANGFQAPTDTAPTMPYCNVDPRDTTAQGYPESYTLQSPVPANTLPAAATSCLISLKITAPAGGSPNGTLVAYIYSTTDSFRVGA